MSRLPILVALVALAGVTLTSASVCSKTYCSCSNDIHPAWTVVNCSVPEDTALDIFTQDLPTSVMELNVRGAQSVMFGAGALNGMTDIRRIRIGDTKMIVFRQFAAVDLSVLNLYLQIDRCDIVRFEKKSFVKLRGPMSVAISDCETVSVEGETFSWLLNLEIANVKELILASGSFTLDPTAANVGDHGPGMSVELKNTTIPEFAKSTFGSSAAKVYLERVDIHAIRTGAFSANTYNIVLAINCSIHLIEKDAFSENSLINYLNLNSCKIQHLSSRALRSAIANINIKKSRFDYVETGAINTTVATVKIVASEFHTFMEKGFELSSWNILQIENNSFDELPHHAIAAPGALVQKLIFSNNEIETMHPGSLSFIGKASSREIEYLNNYFGQPCNCNISHWLSTALGIKDGHNFEANSYCTINEILARCFNVPDQNMLVQKFIYHVCTKSPSINCDRIKQKNNNQMTEIKNPRFPHKVQNIAELSARNKKVIGIVIISCLGFLIIAIIFSLYKWWRRGAGGCANVKSCFVSLKTTCASMCVHTCSCGGNSRGVHNVRSNSTLSVNEYSERHRLNESRGQDIEQATSFQDVAVMTTDKYTQTLPEELTKELLINLKERLENPAKYTEARETIEHLYELSKIPFETPPPLLTSDPGFVLNGDDNIYELPYHNSTMRVGLNNKKMVSVGTRNPSLDKLSPLSPYYKQTTLSKDYSEPKDLAIHLYSEITNGNENRTMLGDMPDVIGEQVVPRGPYLKAVLSPSSSSSSSPTKSSSSSSSPSRTTINSVIPNSSGKMINRPLPEKPQDGKNRADPGEGTSFNLD